MENRETDKYFNFLVAMTIVTALVLIFQHKLGFDMSEWALGALGFIVCAFNLAMGYVEAKRFSLFDTPSPPDVP